MQTSKTKKMSLLITVAALLTGAASQLVPGTVYQAMLENEFIKTVKRKLSVYTAQLPKDRLYVQLDKPLYEPGDDIWLSVLMRDGETLKPSAKSDIVYVELLNPKGTIEKKLSLVGKNGKAAGDFKLAQEAVGGLYKIRAYTNWMKNEGENNVFEKEIQVQDVVLPALKMKLDFERKAFGAGDAVVAKLELKTNENKALSNHPVKFTASLNGAKIVEQQVTTDAEGLKSLAFSLPKNLATNDGLLNVMIDYNGTTESISRSIPIVLNTIDLAVYPEGGDLLCGFKNTVAFRALNEFGKPADVEGIVISDKGKQAGSFSSFHQGMGAFTFTPLANETYSLKITKPVGVTQTVRLPEALLRGYAMNLDNSTSNEVAVSVNSSEAEELSLIAQVRGKIYYNTIVNAVQGNNTFIFPTKDFPAGVAQVTLFDSKGIARAERLVFVNKNRQMAISMETDKEKYLPREKVKLTITAKDERGMPVPANLCMAVVNDQLLTFADDKSGNILSQLLLQQDVEGTIENPAFYFDKKESKADKALDYLLMTAGWRRFTWEKVLEKELPAVNFLGQKAIVSGKVINSQTGKPVACAKIRTNDGREFTADENGHYTLPFLDLSAPCVLSLSAENYIGHSQPVNNYGPMDIYMADRNYRPMLENVQFSSQAGMASSTRIDVRSIRQLPSVQSDEQKVLASAALKKSGHHKQKSVAPQAQKEDAAVEKDIAAPPVALEEAEPAAQPARKEVDRLVLHRPLAEPNIQQAVYYRARQFAAPHYDKQESVETRSDFRNTIYWNPDVEIGYSGKTTVEFYTSDDITSFKATLEGIDRNGLAGHCEKNFFTQLPFAMLTKIPVEVATEDLLSIPVTLKNNTADPLGGLMTVDAPEGLTALQTATQVQTIMPGKAKTIYLDYKVTDKIGAGDFGISFKSCGLSDAVTQSIKIVPKGFPSQVSFSSQDAERTYTFEISHLVKGSLKASFTAFPNVVSDLMKGVEGILQEPYGCFEQTSCTAYPNAMVLDYLKNTGSEDNRTLARATDLLDRGYKRLTTFETSNKGYEWFGANPAHEGLTAYGIMEFTDMKKAGQEIDQAMLERTAQWLLSHRDGDGKGGFAREQRALHDFGRISEDILNAYIVYALAAAGYSDIKKEFAIAYDKAMSSKDAYRLAMVANAAYSLNEKAKGNAALKALLGGQAKDGSFTGSLHSITYSQGQSLTIETTALSILAMLKSEEKNMAALNHSVHYLVGSRSGSGVFSSTQGTILALKALTEFAKFSKKTTEDGTVLIYVDDNKVAERSYRAGDRGTITVDGLEAFIKGEGKHRLKIKYRHVKTPLPYSVAVNWNTDLPNSNPECSIGLQTSLSAKAANVGETVRLTTLIINKKQSDVPSVMAIIGIPAGFTAQPWQLKELQEKKVFDYYEIKGNNIAVYYRGMAAGARKEIHLDLKAELPGEYDAPASSAYLYYMNEFKSWSAVDKVIIKKGNS